MILTIPSHAAPMYISAASHEALPSKLVRDTVYMPSNVALRVLGNGCDPTADQQERQPRAKS